MILVNETPFRVVFGVIWALFYVVRIYFPVKAKGAKYPLQDARSEIRSMPIYLDLQASYCLCT